MKLDAVDTMIRLGCVLMVISLSGLLGCAATQHGPPPIGGKDGRVQSRFRGTPLMVFSQPAKKPTHKFHTVQAGETAWAIARQYNTTVKQIQGINDIDDMSTLAVGTQLRLPKQTQKTARVRRTKTTPIVTSKRYPLRWPVKGRITSRFGARSGKRHDGIDIGAKKGAKVVAAAAGEVIYSDRHGGYGNLVILRHPGGVVTVYAHNSQNLVATGTKVTEGQVIARVGDTGQTSGPHLHFEVRRGAVPQNPLKFLPP